MLERVPQLGDLASRASSSIGHRYASMMRPMMEYVGCSAGVTALLGVNLCLAIEDITIALVSGSVFDSATAMASAARIAFTIAADVQYLSKGKMTGVDHAGHIDGFVWGCGFFVVARLWRWVAAGDGGAECHRGPREDGGRQLGGRRERRGNAEGPSRSSVELPTSVRSTLVATNTRDNTDTTQRGGHGNGGGQPLGGNPSQ